MGLCKCPKRNMTNLFCFEHRVNVCDHCLVESHASCVVQTYLQWLSDSDFDPNCALCQMALTDRPAVRLQCLHVYHWDCLDDMARKKPANTAPAGYRCPQCREAIFPQPNQTSMLIEKLRSTLSNANWARAGLGLPLLPEFDKPVGAPPRAAHPQPAMHQHPVYEAPPNNNYRASTPATILDVDDAFGHNSREHNTFTARKKGYGEDNQDIQPLLGRDADSEGEKYKRRPALEWARGLWRAKYGGSVPASSVSGCRRTMYVLLLLVLGVVTLLVVFSRASGGSEGDPMFNPMANPNIRVAAEDSRMFH